jgi:hypothetical protein
MAVSGRLLAAGALAEQPPSDNAVKFVIASFRKKPPNVAHAPKFTLIVVVIESALP